MFCSTRARLWISFAAVLSLAVRPGMAADASARTTALLSITDEEVKEYVGALADDTFEGRESGSRGGRAAGIYIIEHLKKFGLHGAGPKDSFYQSFGNYNNILAKVEGSDPALKEQVILISAHYDHVGYGTARNSFGPTGLIHNGADDNASGVAGLLEVAEAVSKLTTLPKRSILFAFWDGEEKGLLGSQHWAEHPTVPLDRVQIMINADMIGRLRDSRLDIIGVRTCDGLRRLVARQNDVSQLLLNFTWKMKADSDHHTFFSRDIPIIMVHTGLHNDYHRPSDDADKINVTGLKQVAQLMFGVLVELADAPKLGRFRPQSRNESPTDQQVRETALPPLPGRLGVRWDEQAEKEGEIVLTAVTRGSAADKAGLRVGDKLVKFANWEIGSADQFRIAVLAATNPVSVTVERSSASEPIELSLELPGTPTRLGISWRTDDAEPGNVILNRVTPGSPAYLAGLKVNDRIHQVGRQEFKDGEQFRQLVAAASSPLALEIETAGRIRTVEIPLEFDVPPDASAVDSPE